MRQDVHAKAMWNRCDSLRSNRPPEAMRRKMRRTMARPPCRRKARKGNWKARCATPCGRIGRRFAFSTRRTILRLPPGRRRQKRARWYVPCMFSSCSPSSCARLYVMGRLFSKDYPFRVSSLGLWFASKGRLEVGRSRRRGACGAGNPRRESWKRVMAYRVARF